MAGRPGRSGGANKIDPRLHVLRGTFRPERHGAALAATQPPWQPAEADLARLQPEGRALVDRVQAVYDLAAIEGELLVEGAIALDRLTEIRRTRQTCSLKERLQLDKLEVTWQRALTQCLLSLRVRP